MVMKVTKKFVVVAYDITATKRRNKVVSILEKYGIRSNKSVFECMLTESQLAKVIESIGSIILPAKDNVIYYRLCLDCYSKIIYQPNIKPVTKDKTVCMIWQSQSIQQRRRFAKNALVGKSLVFSHFSPTP